MKYLFLILCILLIFYNFETLNLLSSTQNSSIVIVWKITDEKYLFHILPYDVHVLLDDENFYLYLDKENEETYVPVINLKTNYKANVINYIYLREWTDYSPKIIGYSDSLTDIIDIINSLL